MRPKASAGRPTEVRRGVREARGEIATNLDRLLHDRMRLGIVSALAAGDEMSFTDLKAALNATDGNLSVHARKLEEAGYVSARRRSPAARRAPTTSSPRPAAARSRNTSITWTRSSRPRGEVELRARDPRHRTAQETTRHGCHEPSKLNAKSLLPGYTVDDLARASPSTRHSASPSRSGGTTTARRSAPCCRPASCSLD